MSFQHRNQQQNHYQHQGHHLHGSKASAQHQWYPHHQTQHHHNHHHQAQCNVTDRAPPGYYWYDYDHYHHQQQQQQQQGSFNNSTVLQGKSQPPPPPPQPTTATTWLPTFNKMSSPHNPKSLEIFAQMFRICYDKTQRTNLTPPSPEQDKLFPVFKDCLGCSVFFTPYTVIRSIAGALSRSADEDKKQQEKINDDDDETDNKHQKVRWTYTNDSATTVDYCTLGQLPRNFLKGLTSDEERASCCAAIVLLEINRSRALSVDFTTTSPSLLCPVHRVEYTSDKFGGRVVIRYSDNYSTTVENALGGRKIWFDVSGYWSSPYAGTSSSSLKETYDKYVVQLLRRGEALIDLRGIPQNPMTFEEHHHGAEKRQKYEEKSQQQ